MSDIDYLSRPVRQCTNCGSKFAFQEFSFYMQRSIHSRTTFCHDCQTENYIVGKNVGTLRFLRIAATLFGLFTFILLMKLVLDMFIVRDLKGNTIGFSRLGVGLGVFASIILSGFARQLLLRIFDWHYSWATIDRDGKSAYGCLP